MLSTLRRLINSKLGIVIAALALGIIAIGFAMTDVTGLRHSGAGSAPADAAVEVGGESITPAEIERSVRNAYEQYQQDARAQQQPTPTMAQFVQLGGFDQVLQQIVGNRALARFAEQQGMTIGTAAVDSRIASMPDFRNQITGSFDQARFDQAIRSAGLSTADFRARVRDGMLAEQLAGRLMNASQVSDGMALAYANLKLERRLGTIAAIRTSDIGLGAAPTDAEVIAFYQRHAAQYRVPERRVLRFAVVNPAAVAALAAPTPAEIAAAYQARAAEFQPVEKRSIVQVTVADQAAANALAARVRAGTPLEAAGRALGLEPATLSEQRKADYAGLTTQAVADQVFAAQRGAVVGPIRTPLGYVMARVDTIQQVAGRTLEQATPELTTAVRTQKTTATLARLSAAAGDALNNHATFDELVQSQHLTPLTTPALVSTGANPDDPAFHLPPSSEQIVAAGFAAEPNDDPQLVPVGTDGSFAIVKLDRVVAAAVRPLASIQAAVANDFRIERAAGLARAAATRVRDRVNHGMPLAQALAAEHLTLPPTQPVNATRMDAMRANPQNGQRNPVLQLLFTMAPNTARLFEVPGARGFLIVQLASVQPGNAAQARPLIEATRQEIGHGLGEEYVSEFVRAAQDVVVVRRNDAAITAVKRRLAGLDSSNPQ